MAKPRTKAEGLVRVEVEGVAQVAVKFLGGDEYVVAVGNKA